VSGDDATLTLGAEDGSDAPPRPRLQLRFVHPPEVAGVTLAVPARGRLRFGRGATEALERPRLSREHAELRSRGVGVLLRDLDSRNGTWLGGVAVDGDGRTAMPDAVVRFGDVLGVLEALEEDDASPDLARLPGQAASVRRTRRKLARVGAGVAPALLLGETGTGKEYAARAIHERSGREGRFVAFNCAGLSPQLADSQLFGHRKGAFTGADRASAGLFRSAEGGTLFLDEVADLDAVVQAKLLRAIEQKTILPLGEDREQEVDVRVVAAAHPDLPQRVAREAFRRDLYARLAIAEVHLPALRERRADVPGWVHRFDARWCEREGGEPLSWTVEAMELATLHDWPENLRGVDRVVYGLRLELGPGARVTADTLRSLLDAPPSGGAEDDADEPVRPLPPKPDAAELRRVLEANDWSVRATARHFQRQRKQIYRWMDAYGLR